MSAYYQVKVLKKSGVTTRIKVNLLMPEILFIPATDLFALQILRGGSLFWDRNDFPLAQQITMEQIENPAWLKKHVQEYIAKVDLIQDIAYEKDPEKMTNDELLEYNNKHIDQIFKILEITVTDKKWLDHLKRGLSWEAVAINV